MNSEQEFFEEVNRLLVVTPDPVIEYRLHYDSEGAIVLCSMQSHPPDTNYVVVDRDTYDMYHRYCVVNGQLTEIKLDDGLQRPFVKSTKGFCVVENNAALLLEAGEEYNQTEYYDRRHY
jgi:hypothetical protein